MTAHRSTPPSPRTAAPIARLLLASTLALLHSGAAGCGRSSLLGNGGVSPPCVGLDCPEPLDLAPVSRPDGFAPGDGGPLLDLAGTDIRLPGDGGPITVDLASGDAGCSQKKEICNNGVDDNCNGLIDCNDPACSSDPNCHTPGQEICNNGIDDNNNGLIDCANPECFSFPGCQMNHMCNLANPDCTDPACVAAPACQNLVCMPTVSFGHLAQEDARSERMVSTVGTTDVALTPCAPGGGGMVVTDFYLDGTTEDGVRLDFTQSTGSDHVFGLFRAGVNQACTANPVTCYDPKAAASGHDTFPLAPGHYYLVVQAFTKQHQGTADVTLSTGSSKKVEICNNGVDDDGNGLIDCADPACFNDPSCKGKECQPDDNVGTVIVNTNGATATISTVGKPSAYSITCGGSGDNYAVEFSLAETAGIGLDFNQLSGDHIIGLYKLPPAGKACDAEQTDCLDPSGMSTSIAWGDYPAGSYLFIFKALKPGDEGTLDIRIYAYKNRAVELCHNGIDDDGNGLIDCADPACFSDPGCGPPVCMPDVDLGTLNVGDTASTTQDLVNGVPALKASCAKGGGRSRVIQLTLASHAGLAVNCDQPSGQAVLDLMSVAGPRDSCDQHELSCADPQTIPFHCNYEWPNLQAGTYYVMLQAFQPGDEGTVDIQLSAVDDRALEICNNGIDDDMNGFTDCADKKCALSPYCVGKACTADQSIDPMPLDGSMVQESLDTTNKMASASPPCEAKGGGGTSVVYLNVPAKANLSVAWLQGFGVTNHVLALYPDLGKGLICDAAGKPLSCVPTNGQAQGTAQFKAVPAGEYWLVAAANQPGEEGPIFLDFSGTPAP